MCALIHLLTYPSDDLTFWTQLGRMLLCAFRLNHDLSDLRYSRIWFMEGEGTWAQFNVYCSTLDVAHVRKNHLYVCVFIPSRLFHHHKTKKCFFHKKKCVFSNLVDFWFSPLPFNCNFVYFLKAFHRARVNMEPFKRSWHQSGARCYATINFRLAQKQGHFENATLIKLKEFLCRKSTSKPTYLHCPHSFI